MDLGLLLGFVEGQQPRVEIWPINIKSELKAVKILRLKEINFLNGLTSGKYITAISCAPLRSFIPLHTGIFTTNIGICVGKRWHLLL